MFWEARNRCSDSYSDEKSGTDKGDKKKGLLSSEQLVERQQEPNRLPEVGVVIAAAVK